MQRCALHAASCSLAVAAMSMAAHGDSVVYGDYFARAIVDTFARETPTSTALEVHLDQTVTNIFDELSVSGRVGGSGTFGYLDNWASQSTDLYPTGYQDTAMSRLWTMANGPETYLYGHNRLEIERTFTILDGPGPDMLASFIYSNGPYNTSSYGPDVQPTHSRGVEWRLSRVGGEVLVEGSFSNSGPQPRGPDILINVPGMQPLTPGTYRMRLVSWADWEATAQNGSGLSQSHIRFHMGLVPSPSVLATLSGAAILGVRRRRA